MLDGRPRLTGHGRHDLLQDDILAIFHGDCDSAVLVRLDAVEVWSNPVRHVGGVECWFGCRKGGWC